MINTSITPTISLPCFALVFFFCIFWLPFFIQGCYWVFLGCYATEELNLNLHFCENLKSHKANSGQCPFKLCLFSPDILVIVH
jgi:hypothetical protein